jgi:nondiscriminating glutamyl-tRNA synthetase
MGGVRTALYNYFFARQQGGKFILRIEDTDQTRYVPGAEAYILDALKWCGIEFDESVEKGGPHAPYRQSERTEIYQKYARELVEKGKAYYAFDTPEEIEEMRERLRAAGHHAPTYNFATRQSMQNSLSLPEEEVKRRIEAGEPYVIRMRVPRKEEIRFFDLVRQYVVVHSSQIDDKVLLKSDGLPTYHLANVVDDHLMEVTHVIRGEEWLPSTPLHVLLYRALGWEDSMPKWVHLPLILKPDPALVIKNKALRRELTDKFTEEFMEKHEEVGADKKSKVHSFFQQTLSDKDGFANRLKEKDKDPDFLKAAKAFLHDAFYGKLSKRDGDRLGFPVFPTDWTDPDSGEKAPGYRETGYLPEAFLNALALLGWNPGDDEELMSMERMIEAFSIERISHSGARFDSDKMKWFNETTSGIKAMPSCCRW